MSLCLPLALSCPVWPQGAHLLSPLLSKQADPKWSVDQDQHRFKFLDAYYVKLICGSCHPPHLLPGSFFSPQMYAVITVCSFLTFSLFAPFKSWSAQRGNRLISLESYEENHIRRFLPYCCFIIHYLPSRESIGLMDMDNSVVTAGGRRV